MSPLSDLHVRRTGDDYAEVMAGDLPTGPAWPRDPETTLMQVVHGLAQLWGDVDGRFDDLLTRESDPRATLEMLPDWERAFGLPDPCIAEGQTLVDRHHALLNKMTTEGGQSRAFFIGVAAVLGYTVKITEYSPYMAGISRAGDTRPLAPNDPTDIDYRWQTGRPEIRFWWRVHILGSKTRWFRAGSGQAGVDPMVRIGLATDLQCLFHRWKPAHTDIAFDYGNSTSAAVAYKWFRAGSGSILDS